MKKFLFFALIAVVALSVVASAQPVKKWTHNTLEYAKLLRKDRADTTGYIYLFGTDDVVLNYRGYSTSASHKPHVTSKLEVTYRYWNTSTDATTDITKDVAWLADSVTTAHQTLVFSNDSLGWYRFRVINLNTDSSTTSYLGVYNTWHVATE